MPQLGETVTEGTILRWAKQVGDTIAEDEVLVEISTDKVDTEVPSPAAGTILEILVNEGDTVSVGTPLVVIGAEGEEAPAAEEKPPEPTAEEKPAEPEAVEAAPTAEETAAEPEAVEAAPTAEEKPAEPTPAKERETFGARGRSLLRRARRDRDEAEPAISRRAKADQGARGRRLPAVRHRRRGTDHPQGCRGLSGVGAGRRRGGSA